MHIMWKVLKGDAKYLTGYSGCGSLILPSCAPRCKDNDYPEKARKASIAWQKRRNVIQIMINKIVIIIIVVVNQL